MKTLYQFTLLGVFLMFASSLGAQNSVCRQLPRTAEVAPKAPFVCPVASSQGIRYQDQFGEGCFKSKRGNSRHNAIDLNASFGSNVYAARGGQARIVTDWDPQKQGKNFGLLIVIDHEDGDYTFYAHLASQSVSSGDCVQAGQKIGTVGFTGNAKSMKGAGLSPHLHFEIIRTGRRGLNLSHKPRGYLQTSTDFFLGMAEDLQLGIINPEIELPYICIYPNQIKPFC